MDRPEYKEQSEEQPQADQFEVRGLSDGAASVAEIGLARVLEETLGDLNEEDSYTLAEFVVNARVEELKQFGDLRRLPEIASEEELDDHFDELARLYKQTCQELGLAWPPPAIDDTGFERELDRESEEVAAIESEHLHQPFVVVSVCREDLRGIFSGEELATLSDNDMARIADKMGDAYRDSGDYWDSLEIVTRAEIGRKEQSSYGDW